MLLCAPANHHVVRMGWWFANVRDQLASNQRSHFNPLMSDPAQERVSKCCSISSGSEGPRASKVASVVKEAWKQQERF